MPIVAAAPTGMITFGLAGLGIIVATFLGVLHEMRLPDLRSQSPDPSLLAGGLMITIECKEDQLEAVEQALKKFGQGCCQVVK